MGEEQAETTPEEGGKDYQDYIDVIQKLRVETVSKESYEKLKDENKKLIETLTQGGSIEGSKPIPTQEEKKKEIDELRKALYGSEDNNLSNLEYVEKTLRLREALIDQGERDSFLPFGHDVVLTDQDHDAAERAAKVLQECVDYANGDSTVFTNELQRRTINVTLPQRK